MNDTPADFEEIEHTADWALRVRGADLRGLLSHAARGMSSLLVPDLETVPADVQRQVELDALDAESLLVEWLGELAYWAESELLVFREYSLTEVSPTHLRATLRGGRVPSLQKHIKAVTYHNLKIVTTEGGLETTIVFDV
jgi:SHS2 domain-containing protein